MTSDPMPISAALPALASTGQRVPFDDDAATRALVRAQRLDTFRCFCPAEFLKAIDETKIRDMAAWGRADIWDGRFPGVWLWSADTGEAKTRMLWRQFGRLHVDQGRMVCRVTGLNLAEAYGEAYFENKTTAFYKRFEKFDVWMLDDLDKMKLPDGHHYDSTGDRNGRMLREVFDKFYEAHKPVLVTANEPIDWFQERLGKSTARRMREVCTEIEFST